MRMRAGVRGPHRHREQPMTTGHHRRPRNPSGRTPAADACRPSPPIDRSQQPVTQDLRRIPTNGSPRPTAAHVGESRRDARSPRATAVAWNSQCQVRGHPPGLAVADETSAYRNHSPSGTGWPVLPPRSGLPGPRPNTSVGSSPTWGRPSRSCYRKLGRVLGVVTENREL